MTRVEHSFAVTPVDAGSLTHSFNMLIIDLRTGTSEERSISMTMLFKRYLR